MSKISENKSLKIQTKQLALILQNPKTNLPFKKKNP